MTKTKRDLPILAFKSQQAWNAWLVAQAVSSEGMWLKLAKKSAGVASVLKSEAVDTALCHGWIDGQLDSFDDQYSLVRFTPRRQTSKWSERNRTRALQLIESGQMLPAGLKEVERARKDGRWEAAYAPQSTAEVPDELRAELAKNKKASKFFEALDRVNRYSILYRIHNAKKPETRAAHVKKFVAMLAAGETIHPQKPKKRS
jgi:uncharacterized protein YdeI (YjbR/CyaY-like superfamily)